MIILDGILSQLIKQAPTTYGYQRGGSPIFRTISIGLNLDF